MVIFFGVGEWKASKALKAKDLGPQVFILQIECYETPVQLEWQYGEDSLLDSSIIADLFLSRENALFYYLFIQKNISLALLLVVLVQSLHFLLGIDLNSTASIFLRFPYVIIMSMLVPVFQISLLKEVCKRFTFLFLMGNLFVLAISYAIIRYEIDIWIKICNVVDILMTHFVIFAFDAIPWEVFSHKTKAYWTALFFVYYSFLNIYHSLFVNEKHMFRLGWRDWDLVSISLTSSVNITLFLGKIAWNAFTHPGHFTIIRSLVKQKSLEAS